jgi:hypothetical protein
MKLTQFLIPSSVKRRSHLKHLGNSNQQARARVRYSVLVKTIPIPRGKNCEKYFD